MCRARSSDVSQSAVPGVAGAAAAWHGSSCSVSPRRRALAVRCLVIRSCVIPPSCGRVVPVPYCQGSRGSRIEVVLASTPASPRRAAIFRYQLARMGDVPQCDVNGLRRVAARGLGSDYAVSSAGVATSFGLGPGWRAVP